MNNLDEDLGAIQFSTIYVITDAFLYIWIPQLATDDFIYAV